MERDGRSHVESIAKGICIFLACLGLLSFGMGLASPGKWAAAVFGSGAITLLAGLAFAVFGTTTPPWPKGVRQLFQKKVIATILAPCIILMLTGLYLWWLGLYPQPFQY